MWTAWEPGYGVRDGCRFDCLIVYTTRTDGKPVRGR